MPKNLEIYLNTAEVKNLNNYKLNDYSICKIYLLSPLRINK
jgi:hypothetical protein